MEQNKPSKRLQRYIIAYRMLLDALDEYQPEIVQLRRRDCEEEQRRTLRNHIASRCSRESRNVFRLIPREETRFRGIYMLGILLKVLSYIGTGGVGVCLAGIADGDTTLWLAMALACAVSSRVFSKLAAYQCDRLLWFIMDNDYRAAKTVWADDQKMLLPKRLNDLTVPITSSVDTKNSIRAKLRCTCGTEEFHAYRHPEQGYLEAECTRCGRRIVLFDEETDAFGAHGQPQEYSHEQLQMAQCRHCRSDAHRVVMMVMSDKNRKFFFPEREGEGEYGILIQMHCAECGAQSGDGTYYWDGTMPDDEDRT